MELPECKSQDNKIEEIFIIEASDCKYKNGEFVGIKRKYGKRKREVYKFKIRQNK